MFNKDTDKETSPEFRKGVLTGVIAVLIVIAVLLFGFWLFIGRNIDTDFLNIKSIAKVKTISGLIDKYYYKDISDSKKETGVYRGLMEATDDPYTEYMTPSEYKEQQQETSGEYVGIGISVSKDGSSDEVKVVKVCPDSPAEDAGIANGDIIIAADGYTA